MMNLVVTGIVTGALGYFLFGKLLQSFMGRISPLGSLLIIAAIGVLIMLGGLIAFGNFFVHAFGIPPVFAYAIMVGGIFSLPTLVIILIVWQKVMFEGHSAVRDYATDAIGPFVSLFIAFLLGASHATTPGDSLLGREFQVEIATFSFILDFWQGVIAGAIAFATQKIIGNIVR